MHKNLMKIGRVVSEIIADRQTNTDTQTHTHTHTHTQTDMLIAVLHAPLSRAE